MTKTIPIPANATEITIESYDPKIDFTIVEPPPPPNNPPVVTATSKGRVTLPVDSVLLVGNASDTDGTIAKVQWTKKSGPDATIVDSDKSTATLVSPLAGDYIFNFIAVDNQGDSTSIDVPLTVDPAIVVPPPVTKFFPIVATQRTDEYSRPGAGMERREYVEMVSTVPAMDEYKRFAMFDIDRGVTAPVYDWTMFDRDFNNAIKAGRKFSFGVMPLFRGVTYKNVGGAGLSYPEHLHNAMQKESVKDWNFNGAWVQNWNSPAWLKGWEVFCQAIADRITAKGYGKYVGYIDIRGYGEFGEWHSDDWTGKEPAGCKATSDTLKKLIEIHTRVFAEYQAVLISDVFNTKANSFTPSDVIDYAVMAKTKVGPCGIRCDHWGDPNLDVAMAKNPNATAANFFATRWKAAPVVGEPNNNPDNASFSDLAREVKLYHITSLGNSNFPNAGTAATNVKSASKLMGYRLGITGGHVSLDTDLEFSIDWVNTGVCTPPAYDNYEVWFEFGGFKWKSLFNPKQFLPGSMTFTESFPKPSLNPGTYDLKITVIDPTGVRKLGLPLNSNYSCKITIE